MARSVQDFIDKATATSHRLDGLPAPLPRQVGPLIPWAAFHLGGGFAAEAIVHQLQTAPGWHALSCLLNVDAYDSLEAVAFGLAATSTATALDLCASAAFRLAGGKLPPDREFDLGDWRVPKKVVGITPTPALGQWVKSVLGSRGWRDIEAGRHQMVHRTTSRTISLTVGSHRLPSSVFKVGTSDRPVDAAVRLFVAFGRRRFDTFCAAVAKDFP